MFSLSIKPALGILAALAFMCAVLFSYSNSAVYAKTSCTNADPPSCHACTGAGGDWTTAGCDKTDPNDPTLTGASDSIFESAINILTFVVGAISVIMLIVGGLRYVLSGGDSNSTAAAKNTILYAIVGLVVAFAARAIVFFILDNL